MDWDAAFKLFSPINDIVESLDAWIGSSRDLKMSIIHVDLNPTRFNLDCILFRIKVVSVRREDLFPGLYNPLRTKPVRTALSMQLCQTYQSFKIVLAMAFLQFSGRFAYISFSNRIVLSNECVVCVTKSKCQLFLLLLHERSGTFCHSKRRFSRIEHWFFTGEPCQQVRKLI